MENNFLDEIYSDPSNETPQIEEKERKPEAEEQKDEKPVVENKKETDEIKPEKEKRSDPNKELESTKKALNDAKSWGHKKNKALINAKKKISEFLNKWEEEGNIFEEQKSEALGIFEGLDQDEELPESNKQNNNLFVSLKAKLDKEFDTYKKYNKTPDAEERYQSFFSSLILNTKEKNEEHFDYLQEAEPNAAMDYIMSIGSGIYENMYKGIQEHNGIVEYFEHMLKEKQIAAETIEKKDETIKKLKEEIKNLTSEIAETTEKVYNDSNTVRRSGDNRTFAVPTDYYN